MSSFGRKFDEALDRHITGNYGEDQFESAEQKNREETIMKINLTMQSKSDLVYLRNILIRNNDLSIHHLVCKQRILKQIDEKLAEVKE